MPFIEDSDIARFAQDVVNLKQEDVKRYRDQVNALRERLALKISEEPSFALVKMVHSGSVAKGTALSTINDMDVAVYVKADEVPKGEGYLLNWLAERLMEANPNMKPEQFTPETHCITVSFKGSGLDVDVVPVLYKGDKDDRGQLLNRETGGWLETSIPLHLEFIRKRKAKQPQHFAQVIRLIKWWAAIQKDERPSFRCKSFIVELICAHLMNRPLDFSDYPNALEQFFAYVVKTGLREIIVFTDYYAATAVSAANGAAITIMDPVNPMNNVAASYPESDRKVLVEAASDALDSLTEAHYSDSKGRAAALWKEVMGQSFRTAT